jgi:tetratricopeptide (TPR) repeat protein
VKAVPHLARAAALRTEHLGPEHPDTLRANHRYAQSLKKFGRVQDAREINRRLHDASLRRLGPDHDTTLHAKTAMAWDWAIDEAGKARALLEEVLATRERVFGARHISTIGSQHDLAWFHREAGNLEEACRLQKRALDIALRDHPNHPTTIHTITDHLLVLSDLGRYGEAEPLAASCAEHHPRVLSFDHPDTPTAIDIALEVFLRLGKHDQALAFIDRLIGRLRLVHYRPSPGAIILSSAHRNLRRWLRQEDGATTASGRILRLIERLPDPRALDVLHAELNVAYELRRIGQAEEALVLFNDALGRARRVLLDADRLSGRGSGTTGEYCHFLARATSLQGDCVGPGVSAGPPGLPRIPLTIDAPYRSVAPVADGRIDEGEYGSGVDAVFDDDANPGRMCTMLDGRPRGPGDLSFRLLAAHSDASLFLAFRVRDQFLDDQRSDRRIGSPRFNFNDAAQVFINGDLVANDMPGYWSGVENGNREGFQVLADVLGQKLTVSTEFGNDDWKVGTRRTSDGYIVEFEIPLALIDTKDGPEYRPATTGSFLLMNAAVDDNDEPVAQETSHAILWDEVPGSSPYRAGELSWVVGLRLMAGR